MPRKGSEAVALRICHYFENCVSLDKFKTFCHFSEEGVPKSTIYRVLSRYVATGEAKYRHNKGRRAIKSSPRKLVKVGKIFTKNPSISVRQAAKKLKMAVTTVSRIKVKKLGITARTKKKSPKYLPGQEERAKTGCRKIYEKTRKKVLIIDDETYCTLDPSQVPGRRFVHAKDHSLLEFEDRFKPTTKFPKKFLVWQALDEIGNLSEPYISTKTMNSQIYLEECIKARLIPFIHQHHEMDEILFWPDLATCHYANIVTDYLQSENINFVAKKENPPNVPDARGIEKFWAECKRLYSARPESAKNLRGFKQIWKRLSTEAAKTCGKAIMDHAYKMLRLIGRFGVRKALCDISNKL